MTALTFDTHKFITNLREAGMPLKQAEAVATGLQETEIGSIATENDIAGINQNMVKTGNRLD